jgi:hypothetical protein
MICRIQCKGIARLCCECADEPSDFLFVKNICYIYHIQTVFRDSDLELEESFDQELKRNQKKRDER